MTQTLALVNAFDAFIKGCKTDGTWSSIKASCILAGWNGLNGALTPLAGSAPTNINFVSGDYDRETGLVGDGSTKYLDSNRNNNADPQNSKHISVFRTNAGTSSATRGYIAAGVGLSGASQLTNFSGQNNVRVNDAAATVSGEITATGLWGASRTNSTTVIKRSSAANATTTQSSLTPADGNFFIFARPITTTPFIDGYVDARIAFYSIGESLDLALLDTRVTALINAIAAAIP